MSYVSRVRSRHPLTSPPAIHSLALPTATCGSRVAPSCTLAGAASAQPHAHTTSNPKHLQAQAMLAAPRSPGLAPASCGASPRARYSPPRLTCCRRSAVASRSDSLLAVLQPPPHLYRQVAVLHPRLTRRLPTPRAPRRSPHARPHAHSSRAGCARARCSSRESTQERCKAGRQQGRGAPVNKVRKGNCPHIRPSPLIRSSTLRRLQSHRSRVE